ncbi:uncharacterized protein [Drosophila bipectinata]|uniref:uncharacterized protein n=1 Tax=Drosophila bipectinata TaxID=42026 RepID=UPI001C8964BA|nr:uncharacterized protein LOC108129932 [Drosophila bipectinata]
MGSEWEKTYDRLVRENENDGQRLEHLERQVRNFKAKRKSLQQRIEQEKKDMDVWMDMMERLKLEVKRYKAKKHNLPPKKKKQLDHILKRLPHDNFNERVRLMEVSENLFPKPCKEPKKIAPPKSQDPCDLEVTLPRKCDPSKQSAVDRRIAKINKDMRTLRKINDKTLEVMADIRALKTTINYLEQGHCTNMKITPFVDPRTALKTTTETPVKKAIISLDRLRKTKYRKYLTREVLDVRPSFILENVPQLMPKMYDFLDQNHSKHGKRKN